MFGSGRERNMYSGRFTLSKTHEESSSGLMRRLSDHAWWWSFFRNVGDAGNTSLVDAGTPLGATAVVNPGSAGYLLWECCILASL